MASKPIITLPSTYTLGEVMETMIDRYVRRIPLMEGDKFVGVIDDRDITSVIFSSSHRGESYAAIWKLQAKAFAKKVPRLQGEVKVSGAASLFMKEKSNHRTLLLDGEGIITPWDLTVKWARKILSTVS